MVADKLLLPSPRRSWLQPRTALRQCAAAGADPRLSPRRALFSGVRGLGAGRAVFRLLDQRRFCRAPDRGDARRRDHAGSPSNTRSAGSSGLVQIVAARSAGDRGDAMLYLVTDPDGAAARRQPRRLAERACRCMPGWLSFTVEMPVKGQIETHPARGSSVRAFPAAIGCWSARDISDAAAFRERVKTTLLWAGLIALGIGLLGGAAMSRNMLRRVELVNRTSERVMAGNLSDRVPRRRHQRRVRPARRQPQRHARPDRAADDGDARGDRQCRARSEDAAGAAARAPRAGIDRSGRSGRAGRGDPRRDRRGRPAARHIQRAAEHRRGRGRARRAVGWGRSISAEIARSRRRALRAGGRGERLCAVACRR